MQGAAGADVEKRTVRLGHNHLARVSGRVHRRLAGSLAATGMCCMSGAHLCVIIGMSRNEHVQTFVVLQVNIAVVGTGTGRVLEAEGSATLQPQFVPSLVRHSLWRVHFALCWHCHMGTDAEARAATVSGCSMAA